LGEAEGGTQEIGRQTRGAWTVTAVAPVCSGNVLADVLRQHFIDQRLVPDASTACFLSELIEDARIDTDRDQLPRLVADRGPTDAPHRPQLLGRRIGQIRKINLSRRTPRAHDDSRAAR
jgi:hypothetical protein